MGGGVLSQKWALKCLKMVISNTFSGKTFAKVHENRTPGHLRKRLLVDKLMRLVLFRVDNFSGFQFFTKNGGKYESSRKKNPTKKGFSSIIFSRKNIFCQKKKITKIAP